MSHTILISGSQAELHGAQVLGLLRELAGGGENGATCVLHASSRARGCDLVLSAQNQKDTPLGYGLQVRLGALVHAIGNGAASPAVLKVQAPSAGGAPQVQHYCRQRWLLCHEALRDVGNCSMQPQKFPFDSRSRTWFSYFPANICMGSAHRNSDPRSVLEYRCKSTCKMDLLCDCSRRGFSTLD